MKVGEGENELGAGFCLAKTTIPKIPSFVTAT
jgi:hypothetical protein